MNNQASWWVGGFTDNHISDVGAIDCGMSCVDDYEKERCLGYVGVLGDGLTGTIDYNLFVSQIGIIDFGILIGRIG